MVRVLQSGIFLVDFSGVHELKKTQIEQSAVLFDLYQILPVLS